LKLGTARRECRKYSINNCKEGGEKEEENEEEFKRDSDNLRNNVWTQEKSFASGAIG
jgi:hypothetical protein